MGGLGSSPSRETNFKQFNYGKASFNYRANARAITSDRKGYSWMILPETLNKFDEEHVPTFTLQDILEMLPSYSITYDKHTNDLDKYEIRVDIPEKQYYITHIARDSKSLLEVAFKMLKWCRENNCI